MLRLFQLISETDDLLERSFHEGRWRTFIRTWLSCTVAIIVACFVTTFLAIPAVLVINAIAFVFGGHGINWSFYDLWNFAWPFSSIVGLLSLIFTIPAMLLKKFSGEFTPSPSL